MTMRRFDVHVVEEGFSIRDHGSGEEVGTCADDPLGGAVSVAQGLGLPHMRVLFNQDVRSGVCISMTAGDDASVPLRERRANPVVQRLMAMDRLRLREGSSRGALPVTAGLRLPWGPK